jgi:hypothetical protein
LPPLGVHWQQRASSDWRRETFSAAALYEKRFCNTGFLIIGEAGCCPHLYIYIIN